MADTKRTKFSIEQLFKKVTGVIESNLSLFQGLILTGISIDKKLCPHAKWQYSFYSGTSKTYSKNHIVQLKISNSIILKHLKQNSAERNNAKYDIEIDSLSISNFGTITITVSSIKETGVSERELLRRRLERFTKEKGYDKRTKRELPRLVTSVLALTSKFSEINDDLYSNLNIQKNYIKIVNCVDSREISKHILDNKGYDVVVLYRGGREDEAMNMFSSECIIEAIAKSRTPVCAALGHDMDTPFIYLIADKTFSTPSAFGKAITIHNDIIKEEYNITLRAIADILIVLNESMVRNITEASDFIETTSQHLCSKAIVSTDGLIKELESSVYRIIDKKINDISLTLNKIEHYASKTEEKETSNQKIRKEKQKIHKILLFSAVAVATLLFVIVWLLMGEGF